MIFFLTFLINDDIQDKNKLVDFQTTANLIPPTKEIPVSKNRANGTASVQTEEDSETSFIIFKVGPFKDRRSALRKLTDILTKAEELR